MNKLYVLLLVSAVMVLADMAMASYAAKIVVKSKKGGRYAKSGYGHSAGSINAATLTKQVVKTLAVANVGSIHPIPDIIIKGGGPPMTLRFKTYSSPLNVLQDHHVQPGQTQVSSAMDGPLYLKQIIKKPVLQKVREIIIPEREIIQEIRPVKQYVKTIVAQGQTTPESVYETTSEAAGTSTEAEETTTFEYPDFWRR